MAATHVVMASVSGLKNTGMIRPATGHQSVSMQVNFVDATRAVTTVTNELPLTTGEMQQCHIY